MSSVRFTVAVPVAAARAAVCDALAGAGRPGGVSAVTSDADGVTFAFDRAFGSLPLVLALLDVELAPYGLAVRLTPHEPLAPELLAAVAAWGLGEPDLTDARTIEGARAAARC